MATALALAGTALLVGAGDRDEVDPAGLALAVGAGLAYAVYVRRPSWSSTGGGAPDAVIARVFGWAALALIPVAAVAGVGPLVSPGGAADGRPPRAGHDGPGLRVVRAGPPGVGVAAAGTLTLAEPATATVLGVLVVGERSGGRRSPASGSSRPGWWPWSAALGSRRRGP